MKTPNPMIGVPAKDATGEAIQGSARQMRHFLDRISSRQEPIEGPLDHSVPILAVRRPKGQLRAAVFGYCFADTEYSAMETG